MNTVNPMSGVPDLSPSPGWRPLEPTPERSFVSGDPAGDRLRVRYCQDEQDRVCARVWFGPGAVGPPGHAHGGAMAAVLDEAMGVAAWVSGHPVVAGRLAVDFRRMLRLGTVASVTTDVHAVEGRKVRVTARLASDDGTLIAEAEAVFVQLGFEALAGLNEIEG
jgi:acyl-coenzyme A thioesterase PaaI-like protein